MHLHISYEVPDWNQGCYRDKAPVLSAARPWQMVHPDKSDIAVVLCTGYGGYPGEMVRPGDDLFDRGYDVFCPREPGCGTSGADFQQTGRADWYRSAENCYRFVRSRYQIVYLVGHSMGGLTAIKLAHRFHVSRLVLLAPALDVLAFEDPRFIEQLKGMEHPVRVQWHSDPSYRLHYENAPCDDAKLGEEYFSWLYPRQMLEMYAYQQEAISLLPSLPGNTRLVASGKDVLVGPGCRDLFLEKKRLGYNEYVEVKGATHFSMYDPDPKAEDEAMAYVVSWLDA